MRFAEDLLNLRQAVADRSSLGHQSWEHQGVEVGLAAPAAAYGEYSREVVNERLTATR